MAAQLISEAYSGRDGSIGQLLAKTGHAWRTYRTYRATVAELRSLSARERDDIGLAGADIETVARAAVYGI